MNRNKIFRILKSIILLVFGLIVLAYGIAFGVKNSNIMVKAEGSEAVAFSVVRPEYNTQVQTNLSDAMASTYYNLAQNYNLLQFLINANPQEITKSVYLSYDNDAIEGFQDALQEIVAVYNSILTNATTKLSHFGYVPYEMKNLDGNELAFTTLETASEQQLINFGLIPNQFGAQIQYLTTETGGTLYIPFSLQVGDFAMKNVQDGIYNYYLINPDVAYTVAPEYDANNYALYNASYVTPETFLNIEGLSMFDYIQNAFASIELSDNTILKMTESVILQEIFATLQIEIGAAVFELLTEALGTQLPDTLLGAVENQFENIYALVAPATEEDTIQNAVEFSQIFSMGSFSPFLSAPGQISFNYNDITYNSVTQLGTENSTIPSLGGYWGDAAPPIIKQFAAWVMWVIVFVIGLIVTLSAIFVPDFVRERIILPVVRFITDIVLDSVQVVVEKVTQKLIEIGGLIGLAPKTVLMILVSIGALIALFFIIKTAVANFNKKII